MVLTDLVHAEIRAHIAAHPPERGGALYGPRGYPLVTHFEFDAAGATTAVSYVPSTQLIGNVPRVERETRLQFKGIVHSHPAGLTRPSGGDERTVGSFFRMNPHFSAMALPIVQCPGGRADGAEEFLHWYRAERRREAASAAAPGSFGRFAHGLADRGPDVGIVREEHHVLPVATHLARILEHLRPQGIALAMDRALQPLRVRNAELVGLVAGCAAGHEIMYFVSIDYPVVPPVVLFRRNGHTEQLRFHWDGLGDVEASLADIAHTLAATWRDPIPLSST